MALMPKYGSIENANHYYSRNRKQMQEKIRNFRKKGGHADPAGQRKPYVPVEFSSFHVPRLIGGQTLDEIKAFFAALSNDELAREGGAVCSPPETLPLSKWVWKHEFSDTFTGVANTIKNAFSENVAFEQEWQQRVWNREAACDDFPHQAVYVRYVPNAKVGQTRHCDSDAKIFAAILILEDCEDEHAKGLLLADTDVEHWDFKAGTVVFIAPNVWHEVVRIERSEQWAVLNFTF